MPPTKASGGSDARAAHARRQRTMPDPRLLRIDVAAVVHRVGRCVPATVCARCPDPDQYKAAAYRGPSAACTPSGVTSIRAAASGAFCDARLRAEQDAPPRVPSLSAAVRPVHIGTTVGAASGRHAAPVWPVHWLCHLVNRHTSQDTPRADDAWDPISAATLRRARRYPWRLPHPSAASDFYKIRPAARPTLLVMPSISSHTSTG